MTCGVMTDRKIIECGELLDVSVCSDAIQGISTISGTSAPDSSILGWGYTSTLGFFSKTLSSFKQL